MIGLGLVAFLLLVTLAVSVPQVRRSWTVAASAAEPRSRRLQEAFWVVLGLILMAFAWVVVLNFAFREWGLPHLWAGLLPGPFPL